MESASRMHALRVTVYAVKESLPKLIPVGDLSQPPPRRNVAQRSRGIADDEKRVGHSFPDHLKLGPGDPVVTVQSEALQAYVTAIGKKLVEATAGKTQYFPANAHRFRFYVVETSEALTRNKFATVNGILPYDRSDYGASQFIYNRSAYYRLAAQNTIALQNGMILVPDIVLARLTNESQLAALLAESIASVLKDDVLPMTLLVEETGTYAMTYRFRDALQINQQVIQCGIQLMYRAGFDIRQLPFAWTVAAGNKPENPSMGAHFANRNIPWYASYGFLYLSEVYTNHDYDKLQRGEKRYQQVLRRLCEADARPQMCNSSEGKSAKESLVK